MRTYHSPSGVLRLGDVECTSHEDYDHDWFWGWMEQSLELEFNAEKYHAKLGLFSILASDMCDIHKGSEAVARRAAREKWSMLPHPEQLMEAVFESFADDAYLDGLVAIYAAQEKMPIVCASIYLQDVSELPQYAKAAEEAKKAVQELRNKQKAALSPSTWREAYEGQSLEDKAQAAAAEFASLEEQLREAQEHAAAAQDARPKRMGLRENDRLRKQVSACIGKRVEQVLRGADFLTDEQMSFWAKELHLDRYGK